MGVEERRTARSAIGQRPARPWRDGPCPASGSRRFTVRAWVAEVIVDMSILFPENPSRAVHDPTIAGASALPQSVVTDTANHELGSVEEVLPGERLMTGAPSITPSSSARLPAPEERHVAEVGLRRGPLEPYGRRRLPHLAAQARWWSACHQTLTAWQQLAFASAENAA